MDGGLKVHWGEGSGRRNMEQKATPFEIGSAVEDCKPLHKVGRVFRKTEKAKVSGKAYLGFLLIFKEEMKG